MLDFNKINDAFNGLIGWQNPLDETATTKFIEVNLGTEQVPKNVTITNSSTGYYYNNVHSLLTFENLYAVAPFTILEQTDQAVKNQMFSKWVALKTTAAIADTINDWIRKKTKLNTASNLLQQNVLFETAGEGYKDVNNDNDVVGLEISLPSSQSLKTVIDKVGIFLSDAYDLTLYLFEGKNKTALKSIMVSYNQNGEQFFDLTDANSVILQGGKTYWLCYYQSDLQANNISSVNMVGWLNSNRCYFPYSKLLRIRSFAATKSPNGATDRFTGVRHTTATNYGLNLDFTVSCDYTDFVVRNINQFQQAIYFKVAIVFLRELLNNADAKFNRNERNIDKMRLSYDIEGDSQGDRSNSLEYQYKKALSNISFDKHSFDKVCLPCLKRRGVMVKSLGV